jgi:hypothetical protein
MSFSLRIAANERRRLVLRHLDLHPLFQEMAACQGIDLMGRWWNGLESMLLRALGHCARCRQSKACRAWLRRAAPANPFPAFCPNNRILEACRIMDDGAAQLSMHEPNTIPERPMTLAELMADPVVRQVIKADRPRASRRLRGWFTLERLHLTARTTH